MADLMKAILRSMKVAGTFSHLSGDEKKAYVIATLKTELDIDDDIFEFIEEIINVLIQTEKGKIVFNPIVKKVVRGCCF